MPRGEIITSGGRMKGFIRRIGGLGGVAPGERTVGEVALGARTGEVVVLRGVACEDVALGGVGRAGAAGSQRVQAQNAAALNAGDVDPHWLTTRAFEK